MKAAGSSFRDSYRPGWEDWFDRQMEALDDFDLTLTFCFTPDSEGSNRITPAPRYPESFAVPGCREIRMWRQVRS